MMPSTPDWEARQAAIEGGVVLPDSSDYESIRKPAMANFHDVMPRAIALCETPADVS